MAGKPFDIDLIIDQLLSAWDKHPRTEINLQESDIIQLLQISQDIFMSQPILLEIGAPVNICGDIHGQYADLLRIFEMGKFPPESNYLFLGDYVDRSDLGVECMCLLLCFKIKFPENFFILRGNHESASINRIYGFFDECKRRYNIKLWKKFCDVFNCLPLAAIVEDSIFCLHGGLSPSLSNFSQIASITRPKEIPDEGLICDLLWSDPDEGTGFHENDRGISYLFGVDIIQNFLKKFDLDLICRAHQVVEDGYQFSANRQLVTLFSAPNYCGEFDNAGGIMIVTEDLMVSFKILKPGHIDSTIDDNNNTKHNSENIKVPTPHEPKSPLPKDAPPKQKITQ